MTDKRPRVGLGVLIFKDGKVLFGKRKGPHGRGAWCPPGGHLEFGETWEECAKRETMEEAGIKIKNLEFITTTNDLHLNEGKHYVTVVMKAEYDSGNAKVMEPDKCEGWDWFAWDDLPQPLFLSIQNLIASGYRPEE